MLYESDGLQPIAGRFLGFISCALSIAPACFSRECVETDRCRIVSEADFFFRIGFLLRKEFVLDRRLGGGVTEVKGLLVFV